MPTEIDGDQIVKLAPDFGTQSDLKIPHLFNPAASFMPDDDPSTEV
jgi:hypothetical protein